MKIGFDGKRATTNSTGLGNYSRSLLLQLAKHYPENDYYVYSTKVDAKFKSHPLFSISNLHFKFPVFKKFTWFWRSFLTAKEASRDGVHIFHGLSHELPFFLKSKGIKSVLTVHDLIFLVHPENYSFLDRLIYNLKCKYACKVADHIVAISEKTKADIIHFYQIDSSKISVIYQGCDEQFKEQWSADRLAQIRQKYQLPNKFILNVGTIETRKNLLLAVEALALLDENVHLVAIGKQTPYFQLVKNKINDLNLNNRVHFFHQLPFSDLPAFYQLASLFAYPSRYEGFGIPIIEALNSSLPVIAAKGSCLEEAGGPYSMYFSPDDAHEFAHQINTVLSNQNLKQQMQENGLKFAQKFNSELVAQHYFTCYSNIYHK